MGIVNPLVFSRAASGVALHAGAAAADDEPLGAGVAAAPPVAEGLADAFGLGDVVGVVEAVAAESS